jgi:serine/threonine-protein kinase
MTATPLKATLLGQGPSTGGRASVASLKATIGHAMGGQGGGLPASSQALPVGLAATLAAEPAAAGATLPIGFDQTVAAPFTQTEAGLSTTSGGRTTVLPRIGDGGMVAWSTDGTPRYEQLKPLGEGGVGEVLLARDRDIERRVAIKRLKPDQRSSASLLRFADEVRAVGQLEHPNIVPVHDVGLDEQGQHYLVMKFVQGETIESIIEKLHAGDPATVARFSHEHRARVFLAVLQAIGYAHGRGIIHRDIKPANIMVGPHGEVTVMDWGLAKTVRRSAAGSDAASAAAPNATAAPRLLETQQGALLGTPLYMSPEQAAGKSEELDERSDIYSLTVLLYELMTLEHPLADKTTLEDVLTTIISRNYTRPELVATALRVDAPCEYYHYMVKGLALDPAKRYASASEMQKVLVAILDGKPPIDCHITLAKRVGGESLLWIDRHKVIFTLLFLGAVGSAIWGVVSVVRTLLQA